MSVDYKWMSNGGLLLDGQGDVAFTSTSMETIIDMVRTRLKAAVDGWKLYRIGAGLDEFPGNTSNSEMEVAIRRRVLSTISNGYIPTSMFTVSTIRLGGEIQVFVYLNDQLIAEASVSFTTNSAVA